MPTNLSDEYIRRQFYVIGLGNRFADDFVRELNKSNRDSRLILYDMLPAIFAIRPLTRKRAEALEDLTEQIALSRGEYIDRFRAQFEEELAKLVRGEVAKSNGAFNAVSERMGRGFEFSEDDDSIIPLVLGFAAYDGLTIDQWFTQFKAADKQRVYQSVSASVNNGETEREVIKSLLGTRTQGGKDGALSASQNSARTLARTVTAGVANATRSVWAQRVSSKKNLELLEVYSAILDSRTTFVCASLSGNTYPVGVGPYPPLHRNCRSSRYPIPRVLAHPSELSVKGVDFAKNARRRVGGKQWDAMTPKQHSAEILEQKKRWLAKNVGDLPEQMDFEPWFNRQPTKFKRDYLGPSRYSRWQSGDLEIGDFVQPDGARYTIPELVEKGVL